MRDDAVFGGTYSHNVSPVAAFERDDAAAAVAAARRRQIHDAAMHERNDLERPAGSGFDHARAQRADVVAIDLVERAVALRVVGAAVHEPVGGIGIAQHRVGDRRRGDAAQQLCAVAPV